MIKKVTWYLFVLLAIIIGIYPTVYFLIDQKFGLLATKDALVLSNFFWNAAFYIHIVSGGLALLIGWTQFNTRLRATQLKWHRSIGKIYVVAALLSAFTGLYIALYATGGLVTALGFGCLGIAWFYTTLSAYIHVKNRNIAAHENMMIYSYALCFAAVTLRIWLPLLTVLFNNFILAYKIVAWLCWIPNLQLAHLLIKRKSRSVSKMQM